MFTTLRNKSLIYIIFALQLALLADPAHATTAAKDSRPWFRHPNTCEILLKSYGDGYLPEEELSDFWNYHPRFGIAKKDGRHYLVTRDAATNRKLRSDIVAYAQAVGEPKSETAAKPARLDEIKDSVVYDVTDLMPSKARSMNQRNATRGNCWNFACYVAGVTNGIFSMLEREFTFWLSSPLARELRDDEAPQPGDIVAFRLRGKTQTAELHGLVYVSNDLVFSKNGAAEGLFRLQDSQEAVFVYGLAMAETARMLGKAKTLPVIETSVFRMTSLADYVAKHRSALSDEVITALERLKTHERASTAYNIDPENKMDDAFQTEWKTSMRDMRSISKELKALLTTIEPTLSQRSEPERFLWSAIRMRFGAP